jgi:hypothetical protein
MKLVRKKGMTEKEKVKNLFSKLCKQPRYCFPKKGERLSVPKKAGIYVIRRGKKVFHVGRSRSLRRRLNDHLLGNSSFIHDFFKAKTGTILRKKYDYQYLIIKKQDYGY